MASCPSGPSRLTDNGPMRRISTLVSRARFLRLQGDRVHWWSDTGLPSSVSKPSWRAFVGWYETRACIGWLQVTPPVSPEMKSQRLGLHLNVDTKCIIFVYCPANLTLRLSGTFKDSSCTFQVPVSNGSLSLGKPAKTSYQKATLSRGSLVLSRLRRSKAHLLQQHIDPLEDWSRPSQSCWHQRKRSMAAYNFDLDTVSRQIDGGDNGSEDHNVRCGRRPSAKP